MLSFFRPILIGSDEILLIKGEEGLDYSYGNPLLIDDVL
jgi:hypothetical protein